MDTNRNTHQHVLRALGNFTVHSQQIRTLQSFETEIIETEIAVVDDRAVQQFLHREG